MRCCGLFCLFLVLLSACGPSPNNSADESISPSKPESLDLAVPRDLQGLLDQPASATLFTVGREHEFNQAVGAEVRAPIPSEVERISKYYVIDSVELSKDEVTALVDSFRTAYFEGESTGGVACFYPHHALRLSKDGRSIELLICFMCHNYAVLPGGGYNNVRLSADTGMEDAWRAIVRKHKLRDVSDKEEK